MRIWWTVFLLGCGVPNGLLMHELEPEDLDELCQELSAQQRDVVCTYDAASITVSLGESQAECLESHDPVWFESCSVTVGDVRACQEAMFALSDAEVCDLEMGLPESCAFMVDCAFGL